MEHGWASFHGGFSVVIGMKHKNQGVLREMQSKDGLAIKGQGHSITESLKIVKKIQRAVEQKQSRGGHSGKAAADAWGG